MEKKIRLLLVDDHSLFRESCGRLLEADGGFELIGTSSSIDDAIAILKRDTAEIILLDFDLGGKDGLRILPVLGHMKFEGKVMIVTAGMSDQDMLRAIASGVAGIFFKQDSPSDLIAAIHKIANGEIWLNSKSMRTLISTVSERNVMPLHQPNSIREQAVMSCIFEGLTNREIASQLNISERSVKTLIQQLFDKAGVRTRAQLVRVALERKFIG
jgi:DNA-binding NarL/FixJ family response regulator